MFSLNNCEARILVKIDLLYGIKSFPLFYEPCLNLIKISCKVCKLMSPIFDSGTLTKLKVFINFSESLFTILNWIRMILSFISSPLIELS